MTYLPLAKNWVNLGSEWADKGMQMMDIVLKFLFYVYARKWIMTVVILWFTSDDIQNFAI